MEIEVYFLHIYFDAGVMWGCDSPSLLVKYLLSSVFVSKSCMQTESNQTGKMKSEKSERSSVMSVVLLTLILIVIVISDPASSAR